MNKAEFSSIAKRLKTIWKKDFLSNETELEVWYRLLSDIPYEIAVVAANTYMATKTFEPKPADIRDLAVEAMKKVQTSGELTAAEAFSMYWKAVCNGAYNAQAEFDALPEVVQRAAGNASLIHEAAVNESTNYDVERALFEKRFNAVKKQLDEELKIPESVRELFGKVKTDGLLEVAG